jgi:hypothetical protein
MNGFLPAVTGAIETAVVIEASSSMMMVPGSTAILLFWAPMVVEKEPVIELL